MASAVSGVMHSQEYVMQEDHFVTIDGIKLHYRIGGSGPYLLLLHGFTLSSEQWEEYFDDFIHNFTVIAIDLPGHGKSDALEERFSYNAWADLILKFMNDLGIKSAKGIGHSAGAITLLHMTASQPEALESLILINGAHRLS